MSSILFVRTEFEVWKNGGHAFHICIVATCISISTHQFSRSTRLLTFWFFGIMLYMQNVIGFSLSSVSFVKFN